jgi:hypothetical protein
VNTPSVRTSMRVLADTFEPKRTRKPTASPVRSPKVFAMRSAAARAAIRRGSRTRIFRSFAHGSSANTSGTRVVLPAPGGATSTAALAARNASLRRGSTPSIGRGDSRSIRFVMPGLVPGIHDFVAFSQGVDGRDKPGHDGVYG